MRARAAAPGALAAVDLVVEKLEHQLEKAKGRLVAPHPSPPPPGQRRLDRATDEVRTAWMNRRGPVHPRGRPA